MYQHLRFKDSKAGDILFEYGDRGEDFYIILEGEVELKTPAPVELTGKKATPTGILSFFVNCFEDILWSSLDRGEQLKQMLVDEITALGVPIKNEKFDKIRCLKSFDRAIEMETTNFHNFLAKKINPRQNPIVSIQRYKQIKTMDTGLAFGEISIVTNHRRAATVRCLTDCEFATLRRQDYYWSIGQVKKQQLMTEVKNLRNFSFFKYMKTN